MIQLKICRMSYEVVIIILLVLVQLFRERLPLELLRHLLALAEH